MALFCDNTMAVTYVRKSGALLRLSQEAQLILIVGQERRRTAVLSQFILGSFIVVADSLN